MVDYTDDPNTQTDEQDMAAMSETLDSLKAEHRRIDVEIAALLDTGALDMVNIRRMKKVKLSLKDQITYLENILTPDIIA